VLLETAPVLATDDVPDLVDGDEMLRCDAPRFAWDIFALPDVRRQVREEVAAQFAAFQKTGLVLDHVNAHKHYHLHPTIMRIVCEEAARAGVRAIRVPIEPAGVLAATGEGLSPLGARATSWWARRIAVGVRRAGFVVPDQVFGLAWSGAMTATRIAALLRHLPDGASEIYTHPATRDDFPGHAPGYRYMDELAALTDEEVVRLARREGLVRDPPISAPSRLF
jgi:hopanoid biosynthesis associated protein HpnK